jgi:hypothetical protein
MPCRCTAAMRATAPARNCAVSLSLSYAVSLSLSSCICTTTKLSSSTAASERCLRCSRKHATLGACPTSVCTDANRRLSVCTDAFASAPTPLRLRATSSCAAVAADPPSRGSAPRCSPPLIAGSASRYSPRVSARTARVPPTPRSARSRTPMVMGCSLRGEGARQQSAQPPVFLALRFPREQQHQHVGEHADGVAVHAVGVVHRLHREHVAEAVPATRP